ncbi:TlpA disulfide reductase family protein [uncultured Roseivirga sp.]|uniref:TlpA family protein disulfide reductase n=1 Tax=uncultured Roseivirga sp. TaxID=543088 RepID=UPI0030DA484D|tara:strand:+ start:329 stop:1909 length:1581 start_codon:yes stop_codon:yes gene_type:complete
MNKYLILLTLISTLACSDNKEKLVGQPQLPDHVVLIFNNPQSHAKYTFPTFGKSTFVSHPSQILTINDQFIPTRYRFKANALSDTVTISTKRDLLEVKLTYKAMDELTYYFRKGDTVVFNYEGKKPIAEIINRKESTEVTNFSLHQRDSVYHDDVPAILVFEEFNLILAKYFELDDRTVDINDFIERYRINLTKGLMEELNEDIKVLSSFRGQGMISEEQQKAILSDLYWKLTNGLASITKKPEGDAFGELYQILEDLERDHPVLAIRNDSLLVSGGYQKFIEEKAKRLYPLPKLEMRGRGSASSIRDYATSYDSIQASKAFSPTERKLLQYKNLDKILSETGDFNIETRLKYLTKFKNDYQDTVLFNDFVKKYNVKFEIDDDVQLVDNSGKTGTLNEFISANKGKVIYVDYWASWCAPCIAEMPSSKKFQKEMNNDNIVYLYLSTDRTEEPWQKALKKLELERSTSYRIMNANNSLQMDDLEIQFIPRYMIYDTNGRLVNKDAARPSESKLLKTQLMNVLNSSSN